MVWSSQMFADLHHLHQFVSLEQGGSVSAASWVGGTGAGEANIYFGEDILPCLMMPDKC
jgi:hypothetical protein